MYAVSLEFIHEIVHSQTINFINMFTIGLPSINHILRDGVV